MSSVHSFLSLGALLLISLISLRFNSAVLENSTIETENKVYLTAFSLANDLIEEIKMKAFDAATVKFPTTDPSVLTSPYSLGHADHEVYPNFNDIDDFNDYSRTIDAPHAENYRVRCNVYYVSEYNPDYKVMTQTFYKRVDVTVISPYMKNNILLSFIFTLT
ncbi:MAG: hypothetical protein WBQ32_03620 [Ignavibacteriaceae bacterium]